MSNTFILKSPEHYPTMAVTFIPELFSFDERGMTRVSLKIKLLERDEIKDTEQLKLDLEQLSREFVINNEKREIENLIMSIGLYDER